MTLIHQYVDELLQYCSSPSCQTRLLCLLARRLLISRYALSKDVHIIGEM